MTAAPGTGFETLIAARKACRICLERSPGKLRSGAEFTFDPAVVSHWEQWLGHRNPILLAVGQDFGNVAYFVRHRGRDDPRNPTNRNLHKLLTAAGIAVSDPGERDPEARVFLTNAILCLKQGKMSGAIRTSWIDSCTDNHLLPLTRLLKPPVIVGMGRAGWRAVRRAFALEAAPQRIAQAAGCCWSTAERTRIFAVGHPGPLGLINRPWPQQLADWRRIGAAVAGIDGSERYVCHAAGRALP
jgi:hypothetical protein